jgi:pimeloyl-ACP methyl ester carboxylesterase
MSTPSPTGCACYLPPATGFRTALGAEIEALRAIGVAVHCFDPVIADPTLKDRPRGLATAAGEQAYWQRYTEALLATLRVAGHHVADCVLIGFNFGGSLAARVAATHTTRGLIAAGSIPRLSEFWLRSAHPVAAAARASVDRPDPAFVATMGPLDLSESVRGLRAPALLQFGAKDDWIDPMQVGELVTASPGRMLRWYDDDHDMMGAACRADRLAFVREQLGV